MLHLGILLENMRREGLELAVGKPKVIFKEDNGEKLEPIEYLVVEVPGDAVGPVMQLVLGRRGECVKMDARDSGTHLEFTIPARGLIGLRTRLMNATAGRAIMHHNFHDYQPYKGDIPARINGVMVATENGQGDRPRDREPAGPRRDVRGADGPGLRGPGRRRALPGQRPAGEHLRARRS